MGTSYNSIKISFLLFNIFYSLNIFPDRRYDHKDAVFEINGALGARRAHFDSRAHVFQTCAPDVCTFFHLIIIAIYQRSAWKKSRAHSFKMNAPEGRTK